MLLRKLTYVLTFSKAFTFLTYFETVPSLQNTPNCWNREWVSKPRMATTEIVTAGAKWCLEN